MTTKEQPQPYCPSCEDLMMPGWGAWQCINENCSDYREVKTRDEIENAYEQRWYDAQQRAFHNYHSY